MKPTIADVLHYAADNVLWHPADQRDCYLSAYSCCAVKTAADKLGFPSILIFAGLENMGLCPDSMREFRDVKDKQGARYAWLKFAALIAEEQGV